MKRIFGLAVVLAGLAGGAVACPDFNQSGPGAELSAAQMRKGVSYGVQAGGNSLVWNCPNVQPGTDRGAGYFTSRPDFTFLLSGMGGSRLAVSVVSQCDAALLINTSAANWYYDDDDNGNYDPKITLTRPSDGYLDVWVGTYDGDVCDAVLTLQTY
ncbi:hypothetical protein AB3Y40_05915 [Yoonia sp. R2331]|uniref:hypothetical protein n=1 Tax=Yoonia sp. R2331 TaxID=3237238 RepID=UPI0034E49282